jgi:Uma2 family endonuclease
MATVFQAPEEVLLVAHPNRKQWTRAELRQLIEEGHHEFERYELFDGELIDKMGSNRPHVIAVHNVASLLRRAFGEKYVQGESPISLRPEDESTYRPQPDVLVASKVYASFKTDPTPAEIVLAVEVSDASLRFDLTRKARAYARAGIPEYWVVDLISKRLVVHLQPSNGGYLDVRPFAEDDSMTVGSTTFSVAEIFADV